MNLILESLQPQRRYAEPDETVVENVIEAEIRSKGESQPGRLGETVWQAVLNRLAKEKQEQPAKE
jgi:hypothetical protein